MKDHYDVYFVRYVDLETSQLQEKELTEFGLKYLQTRAMFQVFDAIPLRRVQLDPKN